MLHCNNPLNLIGCVILDFDKIRKIMTKEPEDVVEDLLKVVESYYGEIPYILDFMRETPDVLVPKILYDSAIIREFKRLDPKTIELISIGVSAALKCTHCMRTHIRVATRMGITKEEIFDAILIAGTLSNAAVLAEGTRALDAELGCSREENDLCNVCRIQKNSL